MKMSRGIQLTSGTVFRGGKVTRTKHNVVETGFNKHRT